MLFSAFVVSLVAHTAYYGLIARYEANLIAPLTLMTPLATIAFGVMLTGDRLDARMVAGTVLALGGVLIVALRRRSATEAIVRTERASFRRSSLEIKRPVARSTGMSHDSCRFVHNGAERRGG